MNMRRAQEEHTCVSNLRLFNATKLKALRVPVIIHEHSRPISALVPYDWFMAVQKLLEENAV